MNYAPALSKRKPARHVNLGERLVADLKLSGKFGYRIRQLSFRRLTPKTLDIVELAHRFIEDVHHDVGKIEQCPVTALYSFDGEGPEPFVARVFL